MEFVVECISFISFGGKLVVRVCYCYVMFNDEFERWGEVWLVVLKGVFYVVNFYVFLLYYFDVGIVEVNVMMDGVWFD